MKPCKKICLGLFITAASAVGLYYGALISIPSFVDLNKYKQNISTEIEKQTGFKVSTEDIRFEKTLTPYLKIKMHHTLVLYPDNEIFLKLKDSELKVQILPLIFKKVVIQDAKLTRPIINITLYKDFTTSLEKYITPEKKVNSNGFQLESTIYDTICERYKLKFNDESLGKTFHLEGDDLLIKDVKINDSAHLILKGSLFEDKKEYIKYNIDLKTLLSGDKKQFTFSPFKPLVEYDVKGSVEGKLEINKLLKGNLKLNDFSLNIENSVLKNNNAYLTFKGEEVDIDAIVHPSKYDSAEIKGKFNWSKKKYIDLTTKAKNVNIENLYKIISVLSESLNIKNQLNDIKAKGLLNADFNITSDFKKLKSNGKIEIVNAEIAHKSLPHKIQKINSQINLDNNKIIIEKAQAYINSTPMHISGHINEDMSSDISVELNQVDSNTLCAFVNSKKLPVNVSIGNIVLNIKNYKSKYTGDILCSNIKTMINKKPVSAEIFKINFNEKNIQIPQNTIKLINSPVSVSGSITGSSGQINFAGDILSQNLADIVSQHIKEPYKAQGSIKTAGSIIINGNSAKIKAKLNANKDNYVSYVVIRELLHKPSTLNIDAEINDKLITLKDLSLSGENLEPQIKIDGQIINTKAPEFKNLHIIIPQSISASTNFFGGEEISLNADVIINNTLKNPDIKGSAKVFKYNIKKFLTSIKNADVSFSKDNIRIIAPDILVNDSKFNAVLDVEPKIQKGITVSNAQINSLNLDLNTLFPAIQKEKNPFAENLITIKKGSATINNFEVVDLKAKDISTDFTLKNNTLKLDGIKASAYYGNIMGSLSYDFNHSLLDLKLIGKGLEIKESLYDLCKIEDNLAGKADFTSSVSLIPTDYNTALKSLNGRITFNAYNGRMGTLGKFEYYLYAQNLLYHGLLNATLNRIADAISPNNTAKFKEAKGSLLFQNGYMITEEIKTIGQNMSLYIKGKQNLLTNQANIDIYGRISDEIKSKLGSFGNVSISELVNGQAYQKTNSVMPLPAKVMENIPPLYKSPNETTNTFKVNIYGNINSVSSINSFMWTVKSAEERINLPEFSDL